jgi:hypothetical protein
MAARRRPGDHVVLRQLHGGRVWNVNAVTVAQDDDEAIVLWHPGGAPALRGEGDLFGERRLVSKPMPQGLLRLTRPGRAHSVLHFRHADGSFRGWYVNLEEPLRRTPDGFEFEDHILDIWIEPGADPRWLDEDELADALARGLMTPAAAAAARAEGERVLAEWPFPTGWEEWRPDPGWGLPPPLQP